MSQRKIVVTNDDGIDAPGIAALVQVAREYGEVIVVAPDRAHSGCGHRVTTDEPIQWIEQKPQHWAISGTPADCARVAFWKLAHDADWIFSGINSGGNLGIDVYMSGTVAAVREAALQGKPGIAFSHYRKSGGQFDWSQAQALARQAIDRLLHKPLESGEFWNVNLPDLTGQTDHCPEFIDCPLNPFPLPIHFESEGDGWRYRGVYHDRRRNVGDDVDVCFGGHVAITRMSVW